MDYPGPILRNLIVKISILLSTCRRLSFMLDIFMSTSPTLQSSEGWYYKPTWHTGCSPRLTDVCVRVWRIWNPREHCSELLSRAWILSPFSWKPFPPPVSMGQSIPGAPLSFLTILCFCCYILFLPAGISRLRCFIFTSRSQGRSY